MKPRCPVEDCRFTSWNEAAMQEHAEGEHVRCSCGQAVLALNYSRHAGHYEGCTIVKDARR
jgi:hypothetical protein